MKCRKCGGLLETSEQSCSRCGERVATLVAATPPSAPDPRYKPIPFGQPSGGQASAPAATSAPPLPALAGLRTLPVNAPRLGVSTGAASLPDELHVEKAVYGEKAICARCMDSFREVSMYELGGKQYCERCFHIVVGDQSVKPSDEQRARVEIAPPTVPTRRFMRFLVIGIRVAWVTLIIAFIVAVVLLTQPRPKIVRVSEFDALPAFRPSSPFRRADREGLPESKSRQPSGSDSTTPPAAASPPVDLPIVKGAGEVACPLCNAKLDLPSNSSRALVTCPSCQRQLRIVAYDLLPALKYVGRHGDDAIVRLGDEEQFIRLAQEVSPHTGVFLERFLADGALFVKTDRTNIKEYRLSPPQKVEKRGRLEKFVPKCRDDETTEITVVQGTSSITCDGRGTKEVYHAIPVGIKVDTLEPGIILVPCPLPPCWKQFRLAVRPAPAIELSVAPDTDEVPCPACGFVRHLAELRSQVTFDCLNCKRAVRLTVVPLTEVVLRGNENGAARLEHNGQSYLVSPGKPAWPGAPVLFTGFLEDGRAEFKRDQLVAFLDYSTSPPIERRAQVPIIWRLSKAQVTQ